MIYFYTGLAIMIVFAEEILHRFRKRNKAIVVMSNILQLSYTLVHEFSHAFVSILLRGRVYEMKLNYDLSGHVVNSSDSRLKSVIVTYAGYTMPCFVAIGYYYLLLQGEFQWVLISYLAMAIFSMLFIRNWYGFFWLIGFVTLVSVCLYSQNLIVTEQLVLLLSSILLVTSVYAGFHIFIYTIHYPNNHSDTVSLQKITKIPAILWAILFLMQSVLCTGVVIYYCILYVI